MRKLVCLLLIVVMSLSLFSCYQKYNSESKEEYIFLYTPSEGNSRIPDTDFLSAGEYGLYPARTEKKKESLKDRKKQSLLGVSQKPNYATSLYTRRSMQDNSSKFYYVYDRYSNDIEELVYLQGTDLLCEYFVSSDNAMVNDQNHINGVLDENKAKEIADAFTVKALSAQVMSEYEDVRIIDMRQSGLPVTYMVVYEKIIHGYRTQNAIKVLFSKYGYIKGYSAYCVQQYDNLNDNLSSEKIENAKNTLIDKIENMNLKDMEITSIRITADVEGNPYLLVKAKYKNEIVFDNGDVGVFEPVDEFYINII